MKLHQLMHFNNSSSSVQTFFVKTLPRFNAKKFHVGNVKNSKPFLGYCGWNLVAVSTKETLLWIKILFIVHKFWKNFENPAFVLEKSLNYFKNSLKICKYPWIFDWTKALCSVLTIYPTFCVHSNLAWLSGGKQCSQCFLGNFQDVK